MLNDRAAFIEEILANPDDDAPRLIFSDWLEEQGEVERAELIRVQIKLSRNPPCKMEGHQPNGDYPGCGDWCNSELRRREKKLLETMILYDIRRGVGVAKNGIVRGFIESIRCSMADAAQHLAAIVREHPIRRVELLNLASAGPMTKEAILSLVNRRHPGIEFVLPPEPSGGFLVPPNIAQFLQEHWTHQMAAAVGAAYNRDEPVARDTEGGWVSLPRLR